MEICALFPPAINDGIHRLSNTLYISLPLSRKKVCLGVSNFTRVSHLTEEIHFVAEGFKRLGNLILLDVCQSLQNPYLRRNQILQRLVG